MPAANPQVSTLDLTACTVCGAAHLEPAGFAYLHGGARFPACRCRRCGLVFLARQPTSDELRELYDSSYFETDYHCGHEDRSYFDLGHGQLAAAHALLRQIEQHTVPGRILEVGCAGGFFLRAARDRGWDPVGAEISADAARFARDTLGLSVHTGTLESIGFSSDSLDVAYMGDVLEHVPDPLATLQRVHELLRPGATLVLAVPLTINSLDRRLGLTLMRWLGRTRTLRVPPYHLTEFTPASLRGALTRAGFESISITQSKIPPVPGNPRQRPPLEHATKLLLDAANWLITRLTGALGDRAIVMAAKPLTGAGVRPAAEHRQAA